MYDPSLNLDQNSKLNDDQNPTLNLDQKLVFDPDSKTDNGEPSFSTTNSAAVDFFFKTVRDIPKKNLKNLLSKLHKENNNTMMLKLIFHLRDCRGGKGERNLFYICCRWMAKHMPDDIKVNIKYIPEYGRWDDIFCFIGTSLEAFALDFYANALIEDIKNLKNSESATVSLAAKWAPTENSSADKKYQTAFLIAQVLSHKTYTSDQSVEVLPKISNEKNKSKIMAFYRRCYLKPLRKAINLIETNMSLNLWDEIKFEHVPSLCMFKHKKAFARHCDERWKTYLKDVQSGKTTINANQVFPHMLVGHYIDCKHDINPVVELQWNALVSNIKSSVLTGSSDLGNSLAIIDVSGSMMNNNSIPLKAAIALGLLVSEVASPKFRNMFITFSSNPTFHEIQGSTLMEKVNNISRASWTQTTNYQKVFQLILDRCLKNHVPKDEMPKRLFVFSDMQFDKSYESDLIVRSNPDLIVRSNPGHQKMIIKYKNAGYDVPEIIFWNLRGNTIDFPAISDSNLGSNPDLSASNISMISGFNPALLQLFIDNGRITPIDVMMKAINNPRYDAIISK